MLARCRWFAALSLVLVPIDARASQPNDIEQLRVAYERGRYAVRPAAVGLGAPNPAQAWWTAFDGRGFELTPSGEAWSWGLELRSFGRGSFRSSANGNAGVVSDGDHVIYDRGNGLEEWFINERGGLAHGFTVSKPPAGDSGALTLALELRGDLQPAIAPNRRDVRFLDDAGHARLTYSGLVAFDATGRELEASFALNGCTLLFVVDDRDACYPVTIDPIAQQAYVKASNVDAGDLFGSAIAASGNTVVVGAHNEDSSATGVNGNEANNARQSAGAAYVFVHDGSSWSQQAYLKASNTDANDWFGWAVDIDGDTIVVGARGERSNATGIDGDQVDDSLIQAGAAYVFQRSGTTWSQQAYLKASNTDEQDRFGYSVGVSGDTVVVGAPLEDSGATGVDGSQTNTAGDAGAAYVFTRIGSTWSQQAYLKPSNTQAEDHFGQSVAIDGDLVVVGADEEDARVFTVDGNGNDNAAPESGAAYVFARSGTTWTQAAYLKASDGEPGSRFGIATAVSGETVIVGAHQQSGSGAAYVFVAASPSWVEQAVLNSPHPSGPDQFGFAVAADGERVLVGALWENGGASGVDGDPQADPIPSSGAAFLFARQASVWSNAAYLKASNPGPTDGFGRAVAISGDTVAIGAWFEDGGISGLGGDQSDNSADASGAVYLFDLDAPDCALGTNYCGPAALNSSGQAAVIRACGSATIADDDFTLIASELPPNKFGYFLTSEQQTFVVGPGGSQGNLCLGSPLARFAAQIQNSGPNGVISIVVDLANVPQFGAIAPGDTFNFQCWYRDVNPTSTSNFSDAVSVTFQ